MTRGKVTGELAEKLRRAVERRGVVVWYDPGDVYRRSLPKLDLGGAELLSADEGFFRLRLALEPFLEFVDDEGRMREDAHIPPRIVVRVAKERSACGYALVEAETAGCVLEPGAADPERDTALSSLVRSVFSVAAPLRADELAAKADEGAFTVDEFDRMAEEGVGGIPETLSLLFDKRSGGEILLHFVASDEFDARVTEKNALGDLALLASSETGFSQSAESGSPALLRSALSKHLLLAELLGFISEEARPPALSKIDVPNGRVHLENVRNLCVSWRRRGDLKESYKTAASRVEESLSLGGMEFSPESLEEIETFPFIEAAQLGRFSKLVAEGAAEKALSLFNRRRGLFWSVETPEFSLRWSVAEAAATLLLRAGKVLAALKKGTPSTKAFVEAYVSGGEPWMLLDRSARQLESRFARLEIEGDALERTVLPARKAYAEAVHEMSSAYAAAFEACGGKFPPGAMRHEAVFREAVGPLLENADGSRKTAYFLVDALRYEMAAELAAGFDEGSEVSLRPVPGALPGITKVGMAALLPGAEEGLTLVKKQGDFSVTISGKAFDNRPARMERFRESAGVPAVEMKLGDAARLSAKRKKEVENARLVVVTSQEIDRLGEDGASEEETRAYMDDVLGKIHRAVRSLSRCGVDRFVIAADHGFQLVATDESGLAVDAPGGETLSLHPRAWVGKGGGSGEAFLRLRARDIGIGGDLEFAFPRGLAVFRTRGGAGAYFHGGLSPQEHILPLLSVAVSGKRADEATTGMKVTLSTARPSVTNRIFMVTVSGEPEGLFPAEERRVLLEITSGKKEAGFVVAAAYGFDDASRELTVEAGRPNSVTVMLTAEGALDRLTVSATDPRSQVVLDVLKDLPVDLTL